MKMSLRLKQVNHFNYIYSFKLIYLEKKEIVKERRCLQVNYVTFPTDWKVE